MKKSILFTNGHLNAGGCEKSLVNLLNSIDYNLYDVDLLLFEEIGEYAKDLSPSVHIELMDLRGTYGSLKSVIQKSIQEKSAGNLIKKVILLLASKINNRFLFFLKIFKRNKKKYDVAVAYRVGIAADYVTYSVKASRKLVWWHHGIFEPFVYCKNEIYQNFKKADKIVCVSEASERIVKPYFLEFDNKFTHLSNIVIKEEIIEKSKEFSPFDDDKTIIVSVSRFAPEKHMEYIVFIVNNLLEKGYREFVWYIVGDGRTFDEVKMMIHDYQISDYIVLLGNKNNPYPYLKGADIFVHPSPVESQGIAVIEAMALNKICVINHSIGTDEFVRDGVNAIQTENTVDSLTEKVEYALKNYRKLDFSDAQNETVKKFSPDNIIKKFYNLLEH